MDAPILIFEDDTLLVLSKPPGWVINDSNTVTTNPVLQKWISDNYTFATSQFSNLRSGIVHRLDKETSGIILVAKTPETFHNLQQQFADRKVEKTYVALVHGLVKDKIGIIDEPVGRLPWKRTKFGVFPEGNPAVTNYKVITYYPQGTLTDHNNFTLLELHPKTGRTHQLRVHLKHIGHSIVSDPLYAGRKTLRHDKKLYPRLFLHAQEIKFMHPVTKKEVYFKVPPPKDLSLPSLTTK